MLKLVRVLVRIRVCVLRGRYRRAIVNKRGHSFDANMEVSKIRQSIDGRYNIPYNHPLNDYISFGRWLSA